MKNKVTINRKQKLYVIPCGDGVTCLGFDVCAKWTKALLEELNKKGKSTFLIPSTRKGTHAAYNMYQLLIGVARAVNKDTGYRFSFELEPRLIGLEGKRVEVTSKDGVVRKFWVGKSSGFIPVHLEIEHKNDDGGGAVCLFDTDTIKVIGGKR
jgi:hypothetical protein